MVLCSMIITHNGRGGEGDRERGDHGVNISSLLAVEPLSFSSLSAVPPNIVDVESSPSSVSVRENHNASLG